MLEICRDCILLLYFGQFLSVSCFVFKYLLIFHSVSYGNVTHRKRISDASKSSPSGAIWKVILGNVLRHETEFFSWSRNGLQNSVSSVIHYSTVYSHYNLGNRVRSTVGAWFRRGEVPSPNGLGDPTPTLRYRSLWIDKSTAPWDHSLLLKTGFYCSCPPVPINRGFIGRREAYCPVMRHRTTGVERSTA